MSNDEKISLPNEVAYEWASRAWTMNSDEKWSRKYHRCRLLKSLETGLNGKMRWIEWDPCCENTTYLVHFCTAPAPSDYFISYHIIQKTSCSFVLQHILSFSPQTAKFVNVYKSDHWFWFIAFFLSLSKQTLAAQNTLKYVDSCIAKVSNRPCAYTSMLRIQKDTAAYLERYVN